MSAGTRVDRNSSKKSRRIGRENGGDHIGNLPDPIISCILSRLPTKDAVRTSVLCKDWEYKWTSISKININDRERFSKKMTTETSFVKFVERLLILTEDIERFHLECREKHGISQMTTWIFSVLRRKLRSLKIFYGEAGLILPRKLLNCYFLENLELVLPCILEVPEKIYFGSLTTLHFEEVEILNEDSTTNLVVFDFPVLKKFTLIRCKWSNVKRVKIYAPKMTGFISDTPDDAVVNDYSIKITGDSLLGFGSYGGLPENIVISGGSKVVLAALENSVASDDIHLLEKSGLRFRKLLKEFSSLERLELSYLATKAIAQSKQVGHSLPCFNNLEKLVISGYAGALLKLLHSAPSLKCLTVHMMGWGDYNYDAEDYVPSCIESHLEEVNFKSFSGKAPEFTLLKYLLKNAVKLQKFFISYDDDQDPIPKEEMAEKLSTYPKASPCIYILVH